MDDRQIDRFLRRKFSYLGWSLVGYNVLLYVFVYAALLFGGLRQYLGSALTGNPDLLDLDALLNDAWGYILVILVGMAILHSWKGPDYWRDEILARGRSMSAGPFCAILVLTVGAQVLCSFWMMGLELLANQFGSSVMPATEGITGASASFSMFLYSAVFGPLGEEIIFRGYVLRSLRPYGKRLSILLSAFLFAVFHGNIIQLPYAFAMGLVLGYVAVEYSILWALAVHVFNNFLLADLFTRLGALLPETLYYALDSLIFYGCAIASVVLLIVNRNKIRAYADSEWMDRRCLKCFFTSSGVIVLTILMVIDMLRVFG